MTFPIGSSLADLFRDFLFPPPSRKFEYFRLLILVAIGLPILLAFLLASFAFTKPDKFFDLVDAVSRRIDVPEDYVKPGIGPGGKIIIPQYDPKQIPPEISKPNYSHYTVWSFDRTDEEEARIEQVVRNLGFKFESKPPNAEQAHNHPEVSDIWFWEEIDQKAIKALAKGLVNANVTIRSIKPLDPDKDREYDPENILQIGADDDTEKCHFWTLQDIDNAVSFTDKNHGCLK